MNRAASKDAGGWGRQRLTVVLAVALVVAALLVTGLGYAVRYAIGSAASPDSPVSARAAAAARPGPHDPLPARGPGRRVAIAARPMLSVTPLDARDGIPAPVPGPTIRIPAATGTGPARVATGFPQTPQGAIGQLAAIETSVLQDMSIPHATDVYRAWALPGGVGAAQWPLTRNVQAFLARTGTAGQPAGGGTGQDGEQLVGGQVVGGQAAAGQVMDPAVTVTASPVAGQVKGRDGDSWVLACVLLDVHAVIVTSARVGYGYCERMQWAADPTDSVSDSSSPGGSHTTPAPVASGRWMIAPGQPPAPAPSTWPGTGLAVRAGWRTWVESAHGLEGRSPVSDGRG